MTHEIDEQDPGGRETRRDNPNRTPWRRPPTARNVAGRPATARDGRHRPATTRDNQNSPRESPGPGRSGFGIALPDYLANEFVVVDDLSVGGEATVAVVQHRETGHLKVVKIYRKGIVLPDAVGAKAAKADPRHVLPVTRAIYTGWDAPRFIEVMDFIDAGSLETLLAASGGNAADRARAILVELTDALEHVHDLGLVHRDVKPANVLIRRREPLDLVLADLGIASELDEIRRSRRETSGGVKGTLAYQSPETLNSSDAGRPRDWWALGMTMCEVLTGQHPFKDGAGNVLRDEGLVRTAITMGRIDLSIVTDARWNLLCRGLLTHEPADRWGVAQVRQWLDGQSPAVATGRPHSETATRPVPGFRFAGRRFHTPVELASHMVTHWAEATKLFISKPECDALRVWIRDDLRDNEIETNLLTPTGGSTPVIDARIIAFTTHYRGPDNVVFRGAPVSAGELAQRFLQAGAAWQQDAVLEKLKPEVMAALVESQYNPDADQQGQSDEYVALMRLSRYAAAVDREIDSAAADVVRTSASQAYGTDIGADVRNALPRRIDRARAVARAALLSNECLSGIRTDFNRLDQHRAAWFAELCAKVDDGPPSEVIARTALAVGIGDLAEAYELARVNAKASVERRRREQAAAEAAERRQAERGERVGVAMIAGIGAVVAIVGLIAHKWAAPKLEPSDDWMNNTAYVLLHWPSAQAQDMAFILAIAALAALALAAGLSPLDLSALRICTYCACTLVGLCVLPMILVLLGYVILVVIALAVVAIIALGLGGAAGG